MELSRTAPFRRIYDARVAFLLDTQQGLTKTYNQLKDPSCTEPRILELRRLHGAMDAAVLAAYSWTDTAVPPCWPITEADKHTLETFEAAIIEHLFVLNEQRAEQERLAGAAAASAGKQRKAKQAVKKQRGGGPGQEKLGF